MTNHVHSGSIYGIPEMTKEERREYYQRIYNYLEALINAEKLNPQRDFDGSRELSLLKKIALCDCEYFQRQKLVLLLFNHENSEEE